MIDGISLLRTYLSNFKKTKIEDNSLFKKSENFEEDNPEYTINMEKYLELLEGYDESEIKFTESQAREMTSLLQRYSAAKAVNDMISKKFIADSYNFYSDNKKTAIKPYPVIIV